MSVSLFRLINFETICPVLIDMVQLWCDIRIDQSPNSQVIVCLNFTLTKLNIWIDVLLWVEKYVKAGVIFMMTKLFVCNVLFLSDFEQLTIILAWKRNLELGRERKLSRSASNISFLRSCPIEQRLFHQATVISVIWELCLDASPTIWISLVFDFILCFSFESYDFCWVIVKQVYWFINEYSGVRLSKELSIFVGHSEDL